MTSDVDAAGTAMMSPSLLFVFMDWRELYPGCGGVAV